jgi:hypothetical protein
VATEGIDRSVVAREPVRFLVFSAALRVRSLNGRLARLAAETIGANGGEVDLGMMEDFDAPQGTVVEALRSRTVGVGVSVPSGMPLHLAPREHRDIDSDQQPPAASSITPGSMPKNAGRSTLGGRARSGSRR